MMGIWPSISSTMRATFAVAVIVIAVASVKCRAQTTESTTVGSGCLTKQSVLGGEHMVCVNATPSYFQYSGLKLNRSHWLTCVRCNLNVIKESTFNFPKNNVSYLNLTGNNILTVEPHSFGKFHILKYLSLKENLIETIDPKAFAGLRRLLHLDLSFNKFKIVRSNTFAELESLDILNLNANSVIYLHGDAFVGLANLKYLYLNRNKIKTLLADSFKHLTNLKILYLENNRIREIHPVAFNNLRNLNYLYLNNNSLSYLVQYNFKQLSSLVDLQLRSNSLSEIQTSSFNGLSGLKFLYLGQNNLSRIQPYGLIGLNSLLILDLIDNNFKQFSLDNFKNMNSLTTLWLERNKLRNITINEDSDPLPALKVLDLIENDLKAFDYSLLYEKLPNVQDILIGKNRWNCEFLAKMHEFYSARNVSVCLDAKCNVNETDDFLKTNCSHLFKTSQNVRGETIDDNGNGASKGVEEEEEGADLQNDFGADGEESSASPYPTTTIGMTNVTVLFSILCLHVLIRKRVL
ncbi:hypothetical protein Trydic_g18638 [Trypoxylus dichotomus]